MRHLSRRAFLIAAGTVVTPLAALPSTPACTLASEQEEGPYYIDDETLRRDITENRPGVPLILTVRLLDAKRCSPLRNAALDIWHCDALGVYSGFTAGNPDGGPGGPPPGRGGRGPGGPPPEFPGGFMPDDFGRGERGPGGPPRSRQTDPTRFLRGVQLSDESGLAEFSTVYPGWYAGRAIHIHGKVHIGGETGKNSQTAKKYSGGHVAHTGQFFFPEELTGRISRLEPYSKRLGIERTTQNDDHVFNDQHGSACMLKIERLGKSDTDGFRATVTLAIDVDATPAPAGGFGGRRPGGPPPNFRG